MYPPSPARSYNGTMDALQYGFFSMFQEDVDASIPTYPPIEGIPQPPAGYVADYDVGTSGGYDMHPEYPNLSNWAGHSQLQGTVMPIGLPPSAFMLQSPSDLAWSPSLPSQSESSSASGLSLGSSSANSSRPPSPPATSVTTPSEPLSRTSPAPSDAVFPESIELPFPVASAISATEFTMAPVGWVGDALVEMPALNDASGSMGPANKGKLNAEEPVRVTRSSSRGKKRALVEDSDVEDSDGKENLAPEQAEESEAAPTAAPTLARHDRKGKGRAHDANKRIYTVPKLEAGPSRKAPNKRQRKDHVSDNEQKTLPLAQTSALGQPQAGPSSLPAQLQEKRGSAVPTATPSMRLCELNEGECPYRLTLNYHRDNDHLNGHEEVTEDDKLSKCTFTGCGTGFTTKCARNRHIMKEHWSSWFRCEVPGCGKGYGRRDGVARHMRRKHNGV